MATKLWGGRFTGSVDPVMVAFNESLRFDRRLAAVDVQGSKAYAAAIYRKGIITKEELDELVRGLDLVLEEWKSNTFVSQSSDEDIHTANERRLGELIGTNISGKLHTGRSRNDQVATDMRLWIQLECKELKELLLQFITVLVNRSKEEIDILMPGYTHLQRAQPIRWSHLLLSYAWYIKEDVDRLDQLTERSNKLPLGAGALAGNPFDVDRLQLCSDLNFNQPIMNSLVAVSDRDFIVEFLSWASLMMVHLSRFSEDLIIYSSAEFNFIQLADAYSTGSSLMPQKKNPDSLELIRGKTGRVFGSLTTLLTVLKGLPSTYNKDMQEDKEPLFDTSDTIRGCIQIAIGVISTLIVNEKQMKNSLSTDLLATDLADYLVRKGVPFRETHHISGQAVRLAELKNTSLDKLTLLDLKQLNENFEQDVMDVWNFSTSVDRRTSIGGTSRKTVLDQILSLNSFLSTHKPI